MPAALMIRDHVRLDLGALRERSLDRVADAVMEALDLAALRGVLQLVQR